MTRGARAPLKQRATIIGARDTAPDARTLAIEDSVRTIERELHHLDVHQRIIIERVLQGLIDRATARCSNRRGLCW